MGYSNRPAAVEQVEPYLIEMLKSDKEIAWITKEPNKFRYLIHQAFSAAQVLSKDEEHSRYKEYAALANKYKITCEGNKVIARPRNLNGIVVGKVDVDQRMTFNGVGSVAEIIEILYKNPSASELVFTNLVFAKDDLVRLYLVTCKYGCHIIPASHELVISKKSEDADIAWIPEE